MTPPHTSIAFPIFGAIAFSGMVLCLLEILAPRALEQAHRPWVPLLGFFVGLFGYVLMLGIWGRS